MFYLSQNDSRTKKSRSPSQITSQNHYIICPSFSREKCSIENLVIFLKRSTEKYSAFEAIGAHTGGGGGLVEENSLIKPADLWVLFIGAIFSEKSKNVEMGHAGTTKDPQVMGRGMGRHVKNLTHN